MLLCLQNNSRQARGSAAVLRAVAGARSLGACLKLCSVTGIPTRLGAMRAAVLPFCTAVSPAPDAHIPSLCRWEPICEPWKLDAEMVDNVSPIYRSDHQR